jgi:hypothetical protein
MRQPIPYREPPAPRYEAVSSPRPNQGLSNSLERAFAVESMPEDMRRMLTRIR